VNGARDAAPNGSKQHTDDLRDANEQLLLAALREQELAEAAETARLRAAFLAEASRLLAGVFDPDATLQRVARLAVPTVGDFCVLDVVGAGGEIERAGWAHADPGQQVMFDAARRHVPLPDQRGHPVVEALATEKPVVVTDVTDAWMRSLATGPEHLAFLRATNPLSLMVVPLVAAGRVLGTMTFGFTVQSGRRSTPDALALAEDLAGRAALAVDSARLYRELRQALQVRDDFLASTAHDLRTPLTTIRGHAQLLRRQVARAAEPAADASPVDLVAPLLASLAPALTRIDAAAAKMGRLIGALLDAARLRAGEVLHLDQRPVDLVALVRRVVAEQLLSSDLHQISVDAHEPAVVGQWDAQRLERVLDNLVGNAVKYSPAGGAVVVAVALSGDEGDVGAAGGVALLTVRDEGIGIPAVDLPHVFDRFYRGSNVSGRIGGAGIGLADVRQVVEQHGGTVTVESRAAGPVGAARAGRGSTFTLRLPLTGSPGGAASS